MAEYEFDERDDSRFYSTQVRIPGPAGPRPNVNAHNQDSHRQYSSESGGYDWKPGESDVIDRSLDGPRGLSLLDSSFEEPARPTAEKEKSRRHSNISLGSASTDHDHAAMRDAQSPEARGALYLRSWLFPVRRVLSAYYFLTSLVFIFCFTTKALLDICFTTVTPILPTVTPAAVFKVLFSFLLLLLVNGVLATSNWTLLRSCWAGHELLELKRFECSGQIRYSSPGCDSWDYFIQVCFHVGLEIGPWVYGVAVGVQESNVRAIIGHWLLAAMSIAFVMVCLHALLTVGRYSYYFFCVVGFEESLLWWRTARARRHQAQAPLLSEIPQLHPRGAASRHPSVNLSVVDEGYKDSEYIPGIDRPPRIPEDSDAEDLSTYVPEVEALMRPKFRALPASAERTRIMSMQSTASFSEASDARTTNSHNTLFSAHSLLVDVIGTGQTGRLKGNQDASGCRTRASFVYDWLSDALGCMRRCYFAEETPPAERYIKPVPLMIEHRYYSHIPEDESTLEFILPPSLEARPTATAAARPVQAQHRSTQRRSPSAASPGLHDAFLDSAASSPMLPTNEQHVQHAPDSPARRDQTSIRFVEQRNIAYACFNACHTSLGSFLSAVVFGTIGSLTTQGFQGTSFGIAVLVGCVTGLAGWLLVVVATYLRRRRHRMEKKRYKLEKHQDAATTGVNTQGSVNQSPQQRIRVGPLGAQSSSPMQLANPKAQSQLLSRWLGAFYLGSPLYRTIVGSLSGIGIALFLTALSLAVAHFVGAAQWLIIATAIVVGFIALTLLCATPSGAASQLFNCTSCSWIIYPALLFGITFALLLIARLQVLATDVPSAISPGDRQSLMFPEQSGPALTRALTKAKHKRRELHLPKYLCGRVSACVVVALSLFFTAIISMGIGYVPSPQMTPQHAHTMSRPKSASPYPICGQTWDGLGAVDLTLMAALAFSSEDALRSDFDVFFNTTEWGSEWEILVPQGKTIDTAVLLEFYNSAFQLSAVLVRGIPLDGTGGVGEMVLWLEAGVIQYTIMMLPGFSFVPQKNIVSIVKRFAWLENLFTASTPLWEPIVSYVKNVAEPHANNVVLVGHGIGGGLAKIAGVMTSHHAISIAGPGLLITGTKLGLSQAAIQAFSVNIVPDTDVLPQLDVQNGLIQYISCDKASALACHDARLIAMEVIKSCGDYAGRGFV